MRICLDARTAQDHFPGIGRYVECLGREIVGLLADDERLLVLRDPSRPSRWDLGWASGPRVETCDLTLSPFSLRQQWVVPQLLRERRVEVYHSPYYLMPYLSGVPTVVTIHDLIPLCCPERLSMTRRLAFTVAIRLALRAAQAIITDSASSATDLQSLLGVAPGAIDVIHPGPGATCAAVDAGDSPLRSFGPERYALTVASNKPHKNLARLIEAWAQLGGDAVPLFIVGAWDPRYPEPRERAAALDLGPRVRFLGQVSESELAALYAGASLFVFPSLYEGFGLPLLEAMSYGLPVACSRASSLPEVAGDAAAYFDPVDIGDMARVLGELLKDVAGRERRGQLSRARAAQFSWRRSAAQTLSVYRRLGETTGM